MLSFNRKQFKSNEKPMVSEGFELLPPEEKFIEVAMRKYIWSPIIWDRGYRAQKNFRYADYCALDFDDPQHTLEEITNLFCDSWHVIGTTRSHQIAKGNHPPCDRFRVLLKFTERISDLQTYIYNMKKIIARYGSDESCFDGARQYLPCVQITSVNQDPDAYTMDWEEIPPEEIARKEEMVRRCNEARESYKAIGRLSTYARRCLLGTIPEGERSITLFRLGCELARTGLDYEDAVDRVLRSKTYGSMVISPELLRKIRNQVFDGYKYLGFFACSYTDYCYRSKRAKK